MDVGEIFQKLQELLEKTFGKVELVHVRHPSQCGGRPKNAWMPFDCDPDYIPHAPLRFELGLYRFHIILEVSGVENANCVLAETINAFGHYSRTDWDDATAILKSVHAKGPVSYSGGCVVHFFSPATFSKIPMSSKDVFCQEIMKFMKKGNLKGVDHLRRLSLLIWDKDMELYNGQERLQLPEDVEPDPEFD